MMNNIPSRRAALEFRREQYGWTQAEMARRLHIGRSHYNEIIKGKRKLPYRAACYAFSIGVPASVLLQINQKS